MNLNRDGGIMPDFNNVLVALGALGGLLPDVIRFVKGREKGFPEWFRLIGYWIGLALLVVLGGLAAWLGQATDWQSAIAMGYAGPEIVSRLFSSENAQTRGLIDFPLRK